MSETYDPSYPGQEILQRLWANLRGNPMQPAPHPMLGAGPGMPPPTPSAPAMPNMGVNRADPRAYKKYMYGSAPSTPPGSGAGAGLASGGVGEGPKSQERLAPGPSMPTAPLVKSGMQPSAPQPQPQGGGQAAGTPTAGMGAHSWLDVAKTIKQANPGINPAVLAMATDQMMPFMNQQSKQEWQMVRQQLDMQFKQQKMDIAEERLGLAYDKAEGRGGQNTDKQYHEAVQDQQHALNTMANHPESKEAKTAYAAATQRLTDLQQLRDQTYGSVTKGNEQRFQNYLAELNKRGHGAEEAAPQVMNDLQKSYNVSPELMAKLPPATRTKITQLLLVNPAKAAEVVERIKGLSQETEISKDARY